MITITPSVRMATMPSLPHWGPDPHRGQNNPRAYYVSGPSNNGKLLANRVAKIGRFYMAFNSYGQRWVKEGRRRLGTRFYYVTSSGFLRTNKWQNIKIGGVTRSYYFNAQVK